MEPTTSEGTGRTLSDGAIAERVLDGETHLFELLMRRYNQRLFRLARAYLPDHSEAEDVVQDSYVLAYTKLGQFRSSSFGAWAARIVANQAKARLRRRSLQLVGDMATAPVDPGSRHWAPDCLAGSQQMMELIEAAVDRLPRDFRTVLMLRLVEQLSVEETAEYLDISPATVKTRLFRARSLLQEKLSRHVDQLAGDAFRFAGARCNRIVGAVLSRLSGA